VCCVFAYIVKIICVCGYLFMCVCMNVWIEMSLVFVSVWCVSMCVWRKNFVSFLYICMLLLVFSVCLCILRAFMCVCLVCASVCTVMCVRVVCVCGCVYV